MEITSCKIKNVKDTENIPYNFLEMSESPQFTECCDALQSAFMNAILEY